MLDPNTPAPLPPQIVGRPVTRIDGTPTFAVTVRDAARLLGIVEQSMQSHINKGRVDVCYDGSTLYVLVDSLWLLVPEEERRG